MYEIERKLMVKQQIIDRGIKDSRVIEAMLEVPRDMFVPDSLKQYAYEDRPLPIGFGQTISQPFMVAFLAESGKIKSTDKILEIGTGCGYQAAIISKLSKEVHTVEIIQSLAKQSKQRLKDLKYNNINVYCHDGYEGLIEKSPFDVIIATAAPEIIPETLTAQLAEKGRMVIPVGKLEQEIIRITKSRGKLNKESLLPVRFVPMVKGKI